MWPISSIATSAVRLASGAPTCRLTGRSPSRGRFLGAPPQNSGLDEGRASVMKVLYLFAGKKRRCDMGSALRREAKRQGAIVQIKEVDVLRQGARGDLLGRTIQKRILDQIRGGLYDMVIASPPCSSFSRARHSDGGARAMGMAWGGAGQWP